MLAKKFRLPSSTQFIGSKTIGTPYFIVKVISNKQSWDRYGFIVSKKIDKRATERNRIKRLLRSCIEERWLEGKGHDMLFIIKTQALQATREELSESVEEVMTKLV